MTAEVTGGRKFTQAMSDHVFGDINGHMTAAVMYGMVCPTICGKMVLSRLQVRMTFFSPWAFIASILFKSLGATNGPFLSDLDIVSSLFLG